MPHVSLKFWVVAVPLAAVIWLVVYAATSAAQAIYPGADEETILQLSSAMIGATALTVGGIIALAIAIRDLIKHRS